MGKCVTWSGLIEFVLWPFNFCLIAYCLTAITSSSISVSSILDFFALQTSPPAVGTYVILEFHLHLAHRREFGVKTKDGTKN